MENNNQTSQNLTALPLEQLTEEQISELMTKLDAIKKQKAAEKEPAASEDDAETKVIDTVKVSTVSAFDIPPIPTRSVMKEESISDAEGSGTPSEDTVQAESGDGMIFPDPTCFEEIGEAPDPGAPYEIPAEAEAEAVLRKVDTAYDTRPLSSDDMDDETIAVYRALVRKRRKQRRRILILASTVGVLILAIAVFAGYMQFYKPTIDDEPPSFIGGTVTGSDTDPLVTGSDPIPPEQSGEDDAAPMINDSYERREDVYNFLVLGIDRAANLSDVIMIVSYDVKNSAANVLSLPRDTYINVGSNYHKLNAYFSAAYNRSREKGAERYRDAIREMANFLENGLCIKLDRYVCVDTMGFRDIVNAIGGVDMEIPFDMDYEDPEQDLYIHLKAGYQHLDGEKAEQFVRFRSGYLNGDIGRISAQKLFLTALANQIKSDFDVATLAAVAKTAISYVTTDLTLAEIGYFAKHALALDMDNISFTTLPGGGVNNPDSGASYYVMYAENVRSIVNERFNVYTREISHDVFFANAAHFTSTESYVASVFSSVIASDGTVTAGEIDASGLDIPTKQ